MNYTKNTIQEVINSLKREFTLTRPEAFDALSCIIEEDNRGIYSHTEGFWNSMGTCSSTISMIGNRWAWQTSGGHVLLFHFDGEYLTAEMEILERESFFQDKVEVILKKAGVPLFFVELEEIRVEAENIASTCFSPVILFGTLSLDYLEV